MLPFPLLGKRSDPLRILCLGAHADDIEIGCGGTILKIVSSAPDVSVDWVVFGACDVRAGEARRSAERMLKGARHVSVSVHDFRDGFFPFHGEEIKETFEGIKRRAAPDVIFTHALADRHQDHRFLADLTWNTFRNHLILEYEIPKYDGDLGTPNVFVHLDRTTCGDKVKCILESFPSQSGKQWFTEDTFFALMRLRGMECASPHRFAEAFYCRKAVLCV